MTLKSKERKTSSEVKQQQQPTPQNPPRGSPEGTSIESFIGLYGNKNYHKGLYKYLQKYNYLAAQH